MANNSTFVFKDNTDLVLNKLNGAISASCDKMLKVACDAVQYQMLYGYKDPHGKDGHIEIVDTGKLFDSIRGEVKRASQNTYTVTVGTDVKYAVYVHNGTRKLKARRFITDGIMNARNDLQAIMKDSMK